MKVMESPIIVEDDEGSSNPGATTMQNTSSNNKSLSIPKMGTAPNKSVVYNSKTMLNSTTTSAINLNL